ncbi:MAG: signal peptidase I [Patescibacteria group bacterium]
MKQFLLYVWEILELVIIAGVTVFVIRTFFAQPFLVSGASMSNNFNGGDYLIVDEITYQFESPQRGDVIVFRYPEEPSTFYIKRIIGLPEEHVVIKNSEVFVDDNKLKEEYLNEDIKTSGDTDIILSNGEYFVLGDNRYHSYDSRSWGPVSRKNIIGFARMRLFPFNVVGVLKRSAYQ